MDPDRRHRASQSADLADLVCRPPHRQVELPVRGGGEVLGVFILTPTPASHLPRTVRGGRGAGRPAGCRAGRPPHRGVGTGSGDPLGAGHRGRDGRGRPGWKASRISGAAWATSAGGGPSARNPVLGHRPGGVRRPAAAAGSRGRGGRRSRRGRDGRPGRAWPGRRRSARRCSPAAPVWYSSHPSWARATSLSGCSVEHRLVELGGLAGLPLVLVGGRLGQGLLDLLGSVWAKLPVTDWPGWRLEANRVTATTSAAPKAATAPPRNQPLRLRRRGRRRGPAPAWGPTPAVRPTRVGSSAGARSSTATEPDLRSARPRPVGGRRGLGIEGGQAGHVPLAQGQVVLVREVAGQVLGVGVGQRPGEEVPALLDQPRASSGGPAAEPSSVPPPADCGGDGPAPPPAPADGDQPAEQRAGARPAGTNRWPAGRARWTTRTGRPGRPRSAGRCAPRRSAGRPRPERPPPSGRWTGPPRGPRRSGSAPPTRWRRPAGPGWAATSGRRRSRPGAPRPPPRRGGSTGESGAGSRAVPAGLGLGDESGSSPWP